MPPTPRLLERLEERATPAAIVWDGGGGNLDWFNRFNWSGDALPTLTDDVSISGAAGAVQINNTFGQAAARTLASVSDLHVISGTLQLGGDSHVSGAFQLGGVTFGGVVTGSGTLTLSGNVAWDVNGVMAGTGKTVLTGVSTLEGTTFGSIRESRVVENAGTATFLGPSAFTFRDSAQFRNLAGATLSFAGGAGIGTFFADATSKLVNEGEMIVHGPGVTSIGVTFENSGDVDVDGATLRVGRGTNRGAIDLAGGATLSISGTAFTPPFTLAEGSAVTGGPIVVPTFEKLAASGNVEAEMIRLTGGTLTVPADSTLTVETLEQNGTVSGPGVVTVTGRWSFTRGALSGNARLVTEGDSSFSGGFFTRVDNATVENRGAAVVDAGGSFTFAGSGVWKNLAGSVFEVRTSAFVNTFFTSAAAQFVNEGLVRKTGGGSATIELPVINEPGGRVEIQQGDLALGANSRIRGVVDIASGARWMVNIGTSFLDAGALAAGAGVVFVQGGTLHVAGDASVARLQQNTTFGAVTVDAHLTVGDYIFNRGRLSGTGLTTVTGMSSFTGPFEKTISGHTLENAGTVVWGQGGIRLDNGAVFNNLAGAVFDATFDGSISLSPFDAVAPAFNNAGTLRKSGGAPGTPPFFSQRTTWGVPLNNSGLVDIRTGTIGFAATFGVPGGVPLLTNTGTIEVGTAAPSSAAIVLPATATFPNPAVYSLTGGALTGTGSVALSGSNPSLVVAPEATLGGTLTVRGNVVNRGTVQPATAAGALTITGNYTQADDAGADGRLLIGLRGDSGSGLFGKLTVNGSSQLAGPLEVFADGGFLPDFGDVFQVFHSMGPRTGDFVYPDGGYDLDGYRVLTPEYDESGLRLNLGAEVGPLPIIDPIADLTVTEGQTVAFTATVTGAEPPGPLTFALAAGSSPGAAIDPITGEFEFFAAAGPGEHIFQIAVSDPNAPIDPVDVETFKITVLNVAPVVTITGGQAALDEGRQFTASGSFIDPGADVWTATVDYGDGTGVAPLSLGADKTFALDHHYLDNGEFTITVRIFDGHEFGIAAFDVSVANVAPTAAVAGPASGVRGQNRTFLLSAADDSPADEAAGFTFSIDWGDGTTQQESGLSGLAVEHVFAEAGLYTVTVTATDKDGGVSDAATHVIHVAVAEVQEGVLVVGGTTGADHIQVKKGLGDGASLEVTVNGEGLGEFTGISRAVVYGQDGDDDLDATGSTDVPLELYGGGGDDRLQGGSQDDILDGGAGDDELIGGQGRDILIGGAGADRLISQSGDDILIGGFFLGSELSEARRAALLAAAEVWSSGELFAARVEALADLLGASVADDKVADSLTGASGSDWYFAHLGGAADEEDDLNGANSSDVITEI